MTPFELSESADSMYDDYADSFDLSLLSVDNGMHSATVLDPQQRHNNQQTHIGQTTNTYASIERNWCNNTSATKVGPPQQTQDLIPTVFPPSPTPSIELTAAPISSPASNNSTTSSPTSFNLAIKSEPQSHTASSYSLYPPSPPDSNGAPSPVGYHYDFNGKAKSEPIDALFFQISASPASSTMSSASSSIDSLYAGYANMEQIYAIQQQALADIEANNKDQLIHDYLLDLGAQKKLRSTLDSIFGDDWDVRDDIEPVISLALEQARADVEHTCMALNISSGTFPFMEFFL